MGVKFGTDGWRAIISEDFTFENVTMVAQAIADYFKGENKTMVIGYDWRFLSEKYASLVAEVLAGNGIHVLLADKAVPTPLVSLAIRNMALAGGVVITASHNPPIYNGIKIKAPYGGSADETITKAVEELLGKNEVKKISIEDGIHSKRIELMDLRPGYMKFAKRYLDMQLLKKARLNVLVDCMHGVGVDYIKDILKDTRINVTQIRTNRDPLFGGVNPEPIPKNLRSTFKELKRKRYDIAIINDGDADRIGAITPSGRYMSAGLIMALLLLHFVEDRKWRGGVVKTITNTTLIERIAERHGLRLYETPVGFKHICKLMLNEDILIGGEESGGIGIKDYMPERDGMLLGILLLEMMAYRKKGIEQIIKEVENIYGRFRYARIDMDYPNDKKESLMKLLEHNPPQKILNKTIKEIKSYDGYKFILEDSSWLVLRLSGTEPILRIYAEAKTQRLADEYLEFGKKIALSV